MLLRFFINQPRFIQFTFLRNKKDRILGLQLGKQPFRMSSSSGLKQQGLAQKKKFQLEFDPSSVSKNGTKTEAKVVGTEFGVLLVRARNTYFATAGKCSHYGAPLAKGVVTSDGHIVCPWHGACFNAATGDVEDTPAIAALRTFPVTEEGDGSLWIEVEDKNDNGASVLQPEGCWRNKATEVYNKGSVETEVTAPHVCIIGGGKGASVAAEYLREKNFKGKITIFTREDEVPYDRPKLSKSLLHDISKLALRSKEYYDDLDISFHFNTDVTKIDLAEKKIYCGSDEKPTESYTKLILATGGEPNKLPIPGLDSKNVYLLRSIADASKLAAVTTEAGDKKNIVIIGSSFIGLELAVVLKDHNVSVIGMESIPFEKVMGKEVGTALKALHEQNGIAFYLENSIKEVKTSSNDSSKAEHIVLKDGQSIPADVVILAAGVKPNLRYLGNAVSLEKDGGVKVDEHCRVLGAEDVYAVGDIAHAPFAGLPSSGEKSHTRIEHWDVAGNLGRVAADHILFGDKAGYTTKSFTPYFWSAQGKQLRYCGNNAAEGFDDVVIQGSLSDYKFACFFTKGEKVVGVCSIMKDPVVSQCARLFIKDAMPSKSQLKENFDVLSIPL